MVAVAGSGHHGCGSERASYAEALKRNYEQGPPADWANSYISSYATTHPWEDWAETWAHYLHVVDSLGTARGFGLEAGDLDYTTTKPFILDDLHARESERMFRRRGRSVATKCDGSSPRR